MRWSPDGRKLVDDAGREFAPPLWAPPVAAVAERDRMARNSYFLLRIAGNDGVGEVWRCKRCHGRHSYMTASCLERPFNGLDQIVHALYQQAGDLGAVNALGPTRRQSIKAAILRQVADVPDLGTMHPETARQRASTGQLTAFEIEIGGVRLGRVEEIPKSLAQRLLDRINQSRQGAAKLAVEGLQVN